MKSNPYIYFLIILIGCSSGDFKRVNEKPIGIKLDLEQRKIRPTIYSRNNGYVTGYGPNPKEKFINVSSEKKNKIIGILLGPGLYRSVCYIELFKQFENNKIPVHIITGVGMGAFMAAQYALGLSSSEIEWNFFQLMGILKNVRPFSKKWNYLMGEQIKKTFKKLKIQDLKLTLKLPFYSIKKDRIIYLSRGGLVNLLKKTLLPVKESNYLSSALGQNIRVKNYYENFGVDLLILFDLLGDNISLVQGNDYLIGLYGRMVLKEEMNLSGEKSVARSHFSEIYSLTLPEMALDSTNNYSYYLNRCKSEIPDIIRSMKSFIFDGKKD